MKQLGPESKRTWITVLWIFVMLYFIAVCEARDWYVRPDGKAENEGIIEAPWDIASTLSGGQEVGAGDTVFLLEGTYRRRPEAMFEVKLVGTEDKPIVIRPAPGARVRIDGGLLVQSPSAHVWIRDLEVFVVHPINA